MTRLSTVVLLLGLATACSSSPSRSTTWSEFDGRRWPTECATDADCTLVSPPCDHCGMQVPIAASSVDDYSSARDDVSCDDYAYAEDECGAPAPMRAACESGTCTAVMAQ